MHPRTSLTYLRRGPEAAGLVVVALLLPAICWGADEFRPRQVVSRMRPISDAPVISATEVAGEVNDNELVLGVVIDGEARAYPINMLTGPRREVVNDSLGGQAIAATW